MQTQAQTQTLTNIIHKICEIFKLSQRFMHNKKHRLNSFYGQRAVLNKNSNKFESLSTQN